MEKTLLDLFRQILPLSKKHRNDISELKISLSSSQIKTIVYLLKTKKIGVVRTPLGVSKQLSTRRSILQLQTLSDVSEVSVFTKDINTIIKTKTVELSYKELAAHVKDKLLAFIAPNILGMDDVKLAALLQLFSTERFHLLLLGDPGTGKTDILRSTQSLAPISSFGLGSGTSGAGLSITMSGKKVEKGLLPLAHKGLCCIDELNLMKKADRAALYSAMEKGFITYDKGSTHKKIPAKVCIQATANPSGDKFVGRSLSLLKEQLPFDSALLSRFHLVFLIRRPGLDQLVKITRQIVRQANVKLREEDIDYIKGYIEYAKNLDVAFDTQYEPMITGFIEEIKEKEDDYLVEIGPRTVHGIMRIAQAHARLFLHRSVRADDVEVALKLFKDSLFLDGIQWS